MRVLFFTNIPSPYRVEFFDCLAEKCDLTVVYERRIASDREDDWYINSSSTKYTVCFLRGINYSNDAAIAPGVVNFLHKGKYDIIVVSGYSSATQMLALITLKIKKIPYVLNVDGGMVKPELKIKQWYKTKLISGASCYLSTGNACDEFLMHYGAPKEKLKRYPFTSVREKDVLSKPLTIDEKAEYKTQIGCKSKSSSVILSVGQPIHRKGFDVLIKSIAVLNNPEVEVFIVGGEPNEECTSLIEKCGLHNIHFIHFLKKDELANYYKAADLFVFPTREDIWGLVINEAMAYGLPIITTDKCNAGLELIKDNGLLVKSEDENELAQAIRRIVMSGDMFEMAEASLRVIAGFTLETMAHRHIEIFNSV